MLRERLNSLSLMSIEYDMLENRDFRDVINYFAQLKPGLMVNASYLVWITLLLSIHHSI